jgi:hypothetical protein
MLNGRRHLIRPNLAEMLKSLRDLDYVGDRGLFWVDALCINQDDVVEKSVQIPRMVDIYSAANHTLAWLGQEADDSSYAMDCLCWRRRKEWRTDRFALAIYRMAARRWFRRTWVSVS